MSQPLSYRLRIKGHLGPAWSQQFAGFTMVLEESGETTLRGTVADQAALHRLLARIRDLGLTLVSINQIQSEP